MKRVLLVALLVAACDDEASGPNPRDAVSRSAELKDRVCACRDPICVRRVGIDHAAFRALFGPLDRASFSDEEWAKWGTLEDDYARCASRAF